MPVKRYTQILPRKIQYDSVRLERVISLHACDSYLLCAQDTLMGYCPLNKADYMNVKEML